MGPLSTYYKLRTANQQVLSPGETPLMPVNNQGVQQPSAGVQPQQPQVDTSDPINSLAGMLVTPAEREAKQQRLLENKRRMIAWTGLFEGLRQLGNLYYTSKGASPQTYTNNPAQAIEQGYQQELKNLDDIQRNRQAYAQQIWNLRRQADQDQIRREAHEAQMEYYKNRDEQNAKKIELAEFKAKTDADYKKATLEQKNALNEVKLRLMEGQISKVEAERQYKLIMAGNAQKGTETTVTKSDGTVTTTVRKPAGSKGNRYSQYKKGSSGKGSSSGKYDQYKINK